MFTNLHKILKRPDVFSNGTHMATSNDLNIYPTHTNAALVMREVMQARACPSKRISDVG